jgi:hypothetical protein
VDAEILWFAVSVAPTQEVAAAVSEYLAGVHDALAQWRAARSFVNFAERRVDGDELFGPEVHRRLREVRSRYDPDGLFLGNHTVSAAASA